MEITPVQSHNSNQPAGTTVTTTSTHLIGDNESRQGLIITNAGAAACFLAFNRLAGTATANQGIYLAASGGTLKLDGVALWTGAVDAVTSSGSTTVTVTELL